MNLIHASLVQFNGIGILMRGQSGSGKSQLCLQLIDLGAKLVADDQVVLEVVNHKLIGLAPIALRGKLEIRGLGIVETPFLEQTEIKLVVDLMPIAQIDRMPEVQELAVEILNQKLPKFCMDGQTPAAIAKLRAALRFFKLTS
jgi:HPr kinase/phosphorylase